MRLLFKQDRVNLSEKPLVPVPSRSRGPLGVGEGLHFHGTDSFTPAHHPILAEIDQEEWEDAIYTLKQVILPGDVLNASILEGSLKVYQDHLAKGGNPYLLSRMLMGMKDLGCQDIPGTLRAISQPMRDLERKYTETKQHQALFDASSPRTWPKWAKLTPELPKVLDALTQVYLALPDKVYIQDKAYILGKLLQQSGNLENLREIAVRLKALFHDVGYKGQSAPHLYYRLLNPIQSFGTLARAEQLKYLMSQLMPGFVHPEKDLLDETELSDTLVSAFPAADIEASPGRKLEDADLKAALESITPALWTRIQTPMRYKEILGSLLYDGFNGIVRKNLQPASFGPYLQTVLDLADSLGGEGMKNLRASAWSLFKMDEFGEEEQFQKLRTLKSLHEKFHAVYPTPDASSMFTAYLSKILEKMETKDWSRTLDGFLDAVSVLSDPERAQFKLRDSSLKTVFLQTHTAFTAYEKAFQEKAYKPDAFLPVLKRVFQEYKALTQGTASLPEKQVLSLLNHAVLYADSGQVSRLDFERNIQILHTLLDSNTSLSARQEALKDIPMPVSDALRESITPLCLKYLETSKHRASLVQFLWNPRIASLSVETMKLALSLSLEAEERGDTSNLLGEIQEALFLCQEFKDTVPELPELLLGLPGKWLSTVNLVRKFTALPSQLKETSWTLAPEAQREYIRTNFELLTNLYFPNRFLNTFMLNRERISHQTLFEIFNMIEFKGGFDTGLSLLPELMALLKPYAAMGKGLKPSAYREHVNMATGALTSLFGYIDDYQDGIDIQNVKGIVYNNWARTGSLGLSFTKWQYDAMKRWKGQGPSQKPALMEQSDLFTPLPPREDDKTYHGGFFHHDPKTGLSIEMRRAYIVISKPDSGTLVIRNSSQVFGRDLLQAPAYYHEKPMAADADHLLDPKDILSVKGFHTIFSKQLNRTSQQVKNHEKIKALLDAFDEAMEPYIDWKCGFKDGKPPEGFKEMLRSTLLSAKSDGAMTPFGKKKNVKLAWVNRFGLPFAVRSLKVTDPDVQAELAFYLNVLEKRTAVTNPKEYAEKIPHLLAFLQEGLADNLELVLTE